MATDCEPGQVRKEAAAAVASGVVIRFPPSFSLLFIASTLSALWLRAVIWKRIERSLAQGCYLIERIERSWAQGCYLIERIERSWAQGCYLIERIECSLAQGCLYEHASTLIVQDCLLFKTVYCSGLYIVQDCMQWLRLIIRLFMNR